MIKRFLSLVLIVSFCTMQCAFAATNNNYTVNSIPMPAVTNYQPQNQTQNMSAVTLQGSATKIGKGKTLKAFLQNEVSTTDAVKGDPIVVVLSETWMENGKVIADAGSVINGVISNANAAGGWSKNGALQIDFQTMETPDGQVYVLDAEKIDIQVEKEKNSWVKTAAKVGGIILAVAAVGALIGLGSEGNGYRSTTTTTHTSNSSTTTTRCGRDKDYGHDSAAGAIIGAGIGAAIAVGVAATKKGDNITIPANTNFEILLLDNIVQKGN